jgi:hypothetical protein
MYFIGYSGRDCWVLEPTFYQIQAICTFMVIDEGGTEFRDLRRSRGENTERSASVRCGASRHT